MDRAPLVEVALSADYPQWHQQRPQSLPKLVWKRRLKRQLVAFLRKR
jgi:hypothetical protein